MQRYEVGNYCPDTNNQYVNIWDNQENKNCTSCHRNRVYEEVWEMNEQDKTNGNTTVQTTQQKIKTALELTKKMYIEEDYKYVVKMAKQGKTVHGIITVEEMVDFLIDNCLVMAQDEEIAEDVAKIFMEWVEEFNAETYAMYNK